MLGVSLDAAAEVAAAAAGGTAAAAGSVGGATTTRRALAVARARIGLFNAGPRALRVGGGGGYPAAAAIPRLASAARGYHTEGPPRRSGGVGGGAVVDLSDVNACAPEQLLDFIQTYHSVFDSGAAAGAVHKVANHKHTMGPDRILVHPAMGLLFHSVVQRAPTMSPNQVAQTLWGVVQMGRVPLPADAADALIAAVERTAPRMEAWSSATSLLAIVKLKDARRLTQAPSPALNDALCAAVERAVTGGQMDAATFSKAIW